MVVAIVKRLIASVQLVGLNYMWFENLFETWTLNVAVIFIMIHDVQVWL